ncbi:MAG TPA: AMP-binding protein, partial [Frankiaceae bacterium]|nr:AMP-binding protein [Frankiaceae bacterium]
MKLVKSIVFHAQFRENMPAIAFPGGVATYGALIKAVGAAVEALRTFDLAPGTAVMLDLRNPIHHTAMMFALALMGLPSASVGTAFVAEKAGFLPKLFLTDRDDTKSAGVRQVRVDDRWFATDAGAQPDYAKLLSLPGFSAPDDIVRYVYSSGTTGHPKCVALTQATLEHRVLGGQAVQGWWMHGPAALNMMGFSTIVGSTVPLTAHSQGVVLCYAGSTAEALQMINLFGVAGLVLSVGQLQPFFALLGNQPPPRTLKFMAIVGAKISAA